MTNLTTEELAQYKSICEAEKDCTIIAGTKDVLRMVAEAESARQALRKIKFIALTTTNAPRGLANMVRICIDAGIREHLDELRAAEYTLVKKAMNRAQQLNHTNLYGAMQALAWVLRDHAMSPHRAFAEVEGR